TVDVDAGTEGTYFSGIVAEVDVEGDRYQWSPVDGLSDPNIANPLATPEAPTVYTVTYRDVNGCTATDQVEVVVGCNEAHVAACKPIEILLEDGCSADVEAKLFDNGSYSASGDNLTFSVEPAGPYSVGTTEVVFTVTDSRGQ